MTLDFSRRTVRLSYLLVLMFPFALLFLVRSADGQERQAKSELGIRQRLVERKMMELENQFTSIAENLRKTEPERAKRLIAAYQKAKEDLITQEMSEISSLLDNGEFETASGKIEKVLKKLDELLRLLLNRPDEKMSKPEQIDQYEQWKQDIEEIQKDQNQQRRETSKVANKEEELEKLEAQIQKLNAIIAQQSELIQETENSEKQNLRTLDRLADRQFELRKQTDQLAEEVSANSDKQNEVRDEASNTGGIADGKRSQNIGQPTEQESNSEAGSIRKTEDDEARESSEADAGIDETANAADEADGNSKPKIEPNQTESDASSGDPSGSNGNPSNEQPSNPSTDQSPSNQSPEPGQKSLGAASQSQQQAEEKLGSGKPMAAKRDQEEALAQMEKALSELKKEQRRLASLPPEAVDRMADRQRRTRDKTLDLIEKMSQAPKPDSSGEGEQPVSQPSQQSQPGQESMQQAAQSMQQASKDLDQSDPEQAEEDQQNAEQRLNEALEEIEERLNQLRDETREEKLKRLEGRFSDMLARQRVASAMTIEVEDKIGSLGFSQRRDKLVILRLATEETEISELGRQAYDLLLEDGTSDVFPELVQDLVDSLDSVAHMLDEERTDSLTQLMQQEIESTLLDLLEALEESKEKGQQGGGGGGGGGDQPLLKKSAELKMLKAAQMRLNRKTRQLDRIRESQSDVDQVLDDEIETLSGDQSQLQQMAARIMEKE